MLSLLLIIPLATAIVLLINPVKKLIRPIAFIGSILNVVIGFKIFLEFDKASSGLQFVERFAWIKSYGVDYFVGIDGISFWLVLLSIFIVPIIIVASWGSIQKKELSFHVCLLSLQSFILGSFISIDSILFYCFWELSLIPMYLMIGIWGGPNRIYASIKFFIFTMFGSVLMLISIITLIYMTKVQLGEFSASITEFYKLSITYIKGEWVSPQTLMFIAFSLAFAIKVPMFPLHTWLPDAHTEAPTAGSVILAGVMLKMGTYGFMRFAIPLFPDVVQDWSWLFLYLGTIGIIYGSLVAMVQTDIKKLVAYSSVAHMGYIIVGLFALNIYGFTGSLYQMLNHGISTGALFLLVGMIYERTHTRKISEYGGLAKVLPIYSIFFFIITLSSIAVPGTNGFVGEFLILMGTFISHTGLGSIAVLGVILGAAYMLWMYKKVFFGKESVLVGKIKENESIMDLNIREISILSIMIVMVFWMGIFPNHFLSYSEKSLNHLTENHMNYELKIETKNLDMGNREGGQ